MNRIQVIILFIVLILVTSTAVTAASGSAMFRQRFVTFGMNPRSSGAVTLRGTLGQPITGIAVADQYELCIGIWCGWPFLYKTMMPVVLRK